MKTSLMIASLFVVNLSSAAADACAKHGEPCTFSADCCEERDFCFTDKKCRRTGEGFTRADADQAIKLQGALTSAREEAAKSGADQLTSSTATTKHEMGKVDSKKKTTKATAEKEAATKPK